MCDTRLPTTFCGRPSIRRRELFFSDRLWPEFDAAALDEAIGAYQNRERRFGKTSAQVKASGSRARLSA